MNEKKAQRRIVVGTDGSKRSVDAVQWAIDEARDRDGTVEVVLAWEMPAVIHMAPLWQEPEFARYAQEVLDSVLAAVGTGDVDVPVQGRTVRGTPGGVLVHESSEADLLVVGTHGLGHGKLPGLHLGSVASYCIHHAKCPTVVVRD